MPVHGTEASSTAMAANTAISSRSPRGVTFRVSSVTTVISGRPSRQSGWLHQKHQHHQHEHDSVGGLGVKILGQAFDHPERKAGDDRAHDRPHAADHDYRKHDDD